VLAIDFITAFGRLLRDGNLRDVFALNPQHAGRQIYLRESDLPAWLQLDPADVEFQAEVLLRKRLDLVKWFAPETCRRLDKKLWPVFRQFARSRGGVRMEPVGFRAFKAKTGFALGSNTYRKNEHAARPAIFHPWSQSALVGIFSLSRCVKFYPPMIFTSTRWRR